MKATLCPLLEGERCIIPGKASHCTLYFFAEQKLPKSAGPSFFYSSTSRIPTVQLERGQLQHGATSKTYRGMYMLTNYRLIFKDLYSEKSMSIPLGCIDRVENESEDKQRKPHDEITLHCKDLRIVRLVMRAWRASARTLPCAAGGTCTRPF